MPTKVKFCTCVFIVILCVIQWSPGLAQIPGDTLEVQIETFSISELTTKSQENGAFLNEIQIYLDDNSIIDETFESFKSLKFRYDSVHGVIDTTNMDVIRSRAITASITDYIQRIEGLTASLNSRTSELEDHRADLRSNLEIWQATLSKAVEDGSPPTALQNLNTSVNEIRSSDKKVVAQLDELFSLQNDIQTFEGRIQADLQMVQGISAQLS